MSKKLKLQNLNIQSFVTTVGSNEFRGGVDFSLRTNCRTDCCVPGQEGPTAPMATDPNPCPKTDCPLDCPPTYGTPGFCTDLCM